VVRVPRSVLPASRVDELVCRALPGDTGMGAVLCSFLVTLVKHGPELTEPEAGRLGAVAVDLVTAFLAQHADDRRQTLVDMVKTYVEAHLNDADMSPRTIADAHHISVRYLYQIFQRHGESVAGWIRTRRLERCRRDLEDVALDARPVRAIGARWGLRDPSEFSRAFRATYGMPPGAWRRAARNRRKTKPFVHPLPTTVRREPMPGGRCG
jgi:AraC-like DNA-binding protein